MQTSSARQSPVVYLLSLDALASEVGERAALSLMSKSEAARLPRMQGQRQRELLFGRFALRALLGQRCHVDLGKIRLRRNEFGKPALAPGVCELPVQFNVSHARDVLAVALSEHAPIGVDVEWTNLRLLDQAIALSREFFAQSEAQWLIDTKAALRTREFCRMWTLKEAAVKAVGKSLSTPIDRFIVTDPATHYRFDASSPEGTISIHAWHWDDFAPGLHLAVASENDSQRPRIESLHTDSQGLRAALELERDRTESQA
jgi:4'-phosphopantetheinyl transferase